MHCEAQAELVIKQNNAPLDSFPRIYLCPFWIWMGNRIWKKSLWRRFLLQVMSWKTGGSWIQKVNVARFVKAKYIVVCSNIRCQIYFGKKLFICSFNRIYSRSKTLFRQNQLTLEQKKFKSNKIIFEKDQQLLITVCGHVLTGQS